MPHSTTLPTNLYHYYEAETGPFRNISELPEPDAEALMASIRECGATFASRRATDYLDIRRELEQHVRLAFIAKGGRPVRRVPHYMTLGPCPWLTSWYRHGRTLSVPLSAFDSSSVSFTYGDTFPAMRFQDGKPYRGQVYTLAELPELIAVHGLPQEVNPEGQMGPDRYIEAQVWDAAPLGLVSGDGAMSQA